MIRALGVLLMLAACTGSPPQKAPGPLVPAETGFNVGGTDLEIGFGRAEKGAIEAATKLIGRAPARSESLGSCRRAVWRDGLTMDFRNGAFVGWTDPTARAGTVRAGQPC